VDALEALLLGTIQGLTEFLPVSSSGHLVILQDLLGVREEGILFEVTVHLATLFSVLLFYRKRVVELVVGVLRGRPGALRYAGKLALATLPAVLAVLALGDFFEAQLESVPVAAGGLWLTGVILWSTRRTVDTADASEPSWGAALAIGCAQVLAILPGVSRSGTTVAAALALGVAPAAAAEFSFLMSVLAVGGAAARSLPELSEATPEHLRVLLLGGAVALVSGIAAIWAFLWLLRTHGFHRFAYYVWFVGALAFGWLALR